MAQSPIQTAGDALMIQANMLYEQSTRLRYEADRLHLAAITAWAKAEQVKTAPAPSGSDQP